jgi:hypothetical protein
MDHWRRRFSRKAAAEAPITRASSESKNYADTNTPSSPPSVNAFDHLAPQKAADILNELPKAGGHPSLTWVQDPHREPRHDDIGTNESSKDKRDYWQMAVQQLEEKDANVTEHLRSIQRAAIGSKDIDLITQLVISTNESKKALEAKRWKIVVGSREILVREQFDRISKFVSLFKNVGGAAASLDPLHAGIPLAGLCLLMQASHVISPLINTAR